VCRSTKIQFFSQAVFQRATINDFGEDDVSRIVAYFNTPTEIVSEGICQISTPSSIIFAIVSSSSHVAVAAMSWNAFVNSESVSLNIDR